MRFCRTCGKLLLKSEEKHCRTCSEFHQYWYPEDERRMVLDEYERSNQ